jgi:hypothetical protein
MRYLAHTLRAAACTHPCAAFVLITFCLGEGLIAVGTHLPPHYHHYLPWVVRVLSASGTLLGLLLMRAACGQAVIHSADRITAVARHRRAVHAVGDPADAAGYGTTR